MEPEVFPAHAGMSRLAAVGETGESRFPRTRGDEPANKINGYSLRRFSPHTRG